MKHLEWKPYKNYAISEFVPETISERHGSVGWPAPQTSTGAEKGVVAFVFFVVEVGLVLGPAATGARDVEESLGLLMSVRIISMGFGDGALMEWALTQGIGRIYQPRGLEASPELG
jgi:hypothetical protein